MYALPQDNFYRFLESTRFILRHAKKQKKIVAHHYMQLNNSKLQQNQSIKRFNPNQSSMVIKTESQDTYDIYLTKLFLDQLNNELQYY